LTWVIRAIATEEVACILPLLEQVHAIHAEARPEHYPANPDRNDLLVFLRDWLSDGGATALVAFGPDGLALGYLIFEIETRAPSLLRHGQRRGMLHQIAVDRAQRRAGIGLALIEEMKARLRSEGVARMVATYGSFNDASAGLMRKAGLEPYTIIAEGPV
jgi:ribosomal protein S18 acetylase RimI-like enzyme